MNVLNNPILRLSKIHKYFPGVHALKGIDFEVRKGECVALLGENGAGKSTLIKILGGAFNPDSGVLEVSGDKKQFISPVDSLEAGIAVIYQEFNLVPALTVAENIFLGIEPNDFFWVKKSFQSEESEKVLTRIGAKINPDLLCENLTVAEKQLVEIAKALVRDAKILVMDEPSAALTKKEVEKLYVLVNDLKDKGIGVVYVSHRLEEVEYLCDRAVVMRDGERVGELLKDQLQRKKIIELMVGRTMDQEYPENDRNPREVRLRAKSIRRGAKVKEFSIEIKAGEIVALTGLVGAGRTESARLLYGADKLESGVIEMDGKPIEIRKPSDAINHGICLLTEDRKDQGLILGLSVKDNFSLPNLNKFSKIGWINGKSEKSSFLEYVEKIMIKISGPEQLAGQLSGGNQQKVVLAKWLERNAEILIFDEPTRGIDVGAKYEIYQFMNELADKGKGILMISSELPEVLGMSDRIVIMRDGRITGEVENVSGLTQEVLLEMAIGG